MFMAGEALTSDFPSFECYRVTYLASDWQHLMVRLKSHISIIYINRFTQKSHLRKNNVKNEKKKKTKLDEKVFSVCTTRFEKSSCVPQSLLPQCWSSFNYHFLL